MAVKAVKYSSVTGEKIAKILDSRNALDYRHAKVAELSDDRYEYRPNNEGRRVKT